MMEFDTLKGQTDIYGNVAEETIVAGEAGGGNRELYAGDCGSLPAEARLALCALVRESCVTREDKAVWRALELYRDEIAARLSDMFLVLDFRPRAGVAAARQADCPDMPVRHKLKASKPLTGVGAVIAGILAEAYSTQRAAGREKAYMPEDEIIEAVRDVFAETPDKVSLDAKAVRALDRLEKLGYVRRNKDTGYLMIGAALEFFDLQAAEAALATYRGSGGAQEDTAAQEAEGAAEAAPTLF